MPCKKGKSDRNATRLRRIIAERDMRIDALDKELEGEKSKITSLQSSMASLLLKVEHLQLQKGHVAHLFNDSENQGRD